MLLCFCGGGNLNNVLVGLNIKKARKEKKLTQQNLADAIGKTESSIRKYEKGIVEVPNSVLQKIAETLSTDLITLIGLDNRNGDDKSSFYDLLKSIGYTIIQDDREHTPFIETLSGEVYALERGDLQKFSEVTEAYIRFTIDTTLAKRKKLK
jgi:transcriptional regulator with XRE-family HTH domain